jgi:hypothetical protein
MLKGPYHFIDLSLPGGKWRGGGGEDPPGPDENLGGQIVSYTQHRETRSRQSLFGRPGVDISAHFVYTEKSMV